MYQGLEYELSQVMPLAVETGLFRSLATFYKPPTTQGATGNQSGDYTPVSGLTNIACMDAPESNMRILAKEAQTVDMVEAQTFRHVLLDKYYSFPANAATGLGWRVTVDGTLYDLLGAEPDSQRTQTRIKLQLVTL